MENFVWSLSYLVHHETISTIKQTIFTFGWNQEIKSGQPFYGFFLTLRNLSNFSKDSLSWNSLRSNSSLLCWRLSIFIWNSWRNEKTNTLMMNLQWLLFSDFAANLISFQCLQNSPTNNSFSFFPQIMYKFQVFILILYNTPIFQL